jgi:hypothetical protein
VTKRIIALLACLFAVLAISAAPANAGWDFKSAPQGWDFSVTTPSPQYTWGSPELEKAIAAKRTAPKTESVTEVGPYVQNTRWYTPVICVDNQTTWALQTVVTEWAKANDIILQYEGCAGWADSHRIDVKFGAQTNTCVHFYAANDAQTPINHVTRMIMYVDHNAGGCWDGSVKINHMKSAGIGVALLLNPFDTYPPTYVSVMRTSSFNTVSYAQPGDRNTFDYYNEL